ncbi:MAG TPA: MFS transporter, partial [Nitrososphaerales archaeon]|nr:MFS transporter [Nitrososphaerales archaeon]
MEYKWIALTNTTLGTLLAAIDLNIVLIALPSIFRGIQINPLTSFTYLLWILFGYSIVTATLLVSFGRISDIFGRVRLYNLGFAIYTIGSLLLFLTPNTGDLGAIELVSFRVVQGIGAAFLFSNSAAILTDAFPPNERGKALGLNQVAILAGSILGLVLGGVLATYNWRYVFLVSVPFGVFGTAWAHFKLRELATIRKGQKIDVWGNVTFGAGLITLLISITYGIVSYHGEPMGWSNPLVIAGLFSSVALLCVFPFIETRVKDPMFRLELFRRRIFAAGNFADFLAALARGGVTFMLIILLQAIWLPLHGISYQDTPFWAGIYIIPFSLGFVLMGPLSGFLSDRYGARGFSTLGMIITGSAFLLLSTLPFNFYYPYFAIIVFAMGIGLGMFSSPNLTSIMNSVPPQNRGAAAGMRTTLLNTGTTIGTSILFTIVTIVLATSLPGYLASAASNSGAPQLGTSVFQNVPPTSAIFAAFLGYNPMQTILSSLPSSLTSTLSAGTISILTSSTWFPNAFAPAFMSSLRTAIYLNATLAFVAAIASVVRGKRYFYV